MTEQPVIYSVNGPVVKVRDTDVFSMMEMVYVGKRRLIGEVIGLSDEETTIQVYEGTSGLKTGEPVEPTGAPMSVTLGPGILTNIFDGIERPLRALEEASGAFIGDGLSVPVLDTEKQYDVTVKVKVGTQMQGGEVYASCPETSVILHLCMIPPNLSGKVVYAAKDGKYTINDEILRLEDATGKVHSLTLCQKWPVRRARPAAKRLAPSRPMITGQRVLDTLFPIARGGTAAIPGGFGTGKTMTQHQIAKWCDADIIVYIGCGERGNEMTDVLTEFPTLIDPRTGRSLMERTILIANTSNMPVAAREVSLYSGITLAEYYRDMGMHVAIMADSTSRWAEALRELSGRMEEMPAEEGFPAYLPTRLAEFYERAGRVNALCGEEGSVSVIGAVSPPGGDFSEPVTQHTKRFIRCFWALDRALANARHYPAIGWIESYSEYADEIREWWDKLDSRWAQVRLSALDLLKEEQRLEQIVRLIGPDALPDEKKIILTVADMIKNGFLQQSAFDAVDVYSVPEKQILILLLIMQFYEKGLMLIKSGVPLLKIASLSVKDEIVRIKSSVPNDKLEQIHEIEKRLEDQISEVARLYRR